MKEPKTIWTNDFPLTEEVTKEAIDCLNYGIPVRIGSSCIGHTRSEMIDGCARKFFKEIGAKQVQIPYEYMPECSATYYMMG